MAISIGDIDYDAIFISAIHNHLGSRKTYYCFCSKMGYSLANGGEICEYRDRVLIKFLLVLFFFVPFTVACLFLVHFSLDVIIPALSRVYSPHYLVLSEV